MEDLGSYITLRGRRIELEKHPTDFTVITGTEPLESVPEMSAVQSVLLGRGVQRCSSPSPADRDRVMAALKRHAQALHVYLVKGTGEEMLIDNRILLRLKHDDPKLLEAVMSRFDMITEAHMGKTYVLRPTKAGVPPLETANTIAKMEGVESCNPQVLLPIKRMNNR